jgi:hypothetical protein
MCGFFDQLSNREATPERSKARGKGSRWLAREGDIFNLP